LLHQIGTKGRSGFLRLDEAKIEAGLKFGQALSCVNAQYEGARGPMYSLKISEFLTMVESMLSTR
jgi:hypothetical protein